MNKPSGNLENSQRLSLANRIDVICDEFELSWTASRPQQIETCLDGLDTFEARSLFRELLAVEIDYRARQGDAPSAHEYLERFADFAEIVDEVFHEGVHKNVGGHRDLEEDSWNPAAKLEDTLAECFPFTKEIAAIIAPHVSLREFESGTHLFHQGADGDSLLVVLAGYVEVGVNCEHDVSRIIDRVGPGQILGEMALLTGEPRSADVVAITRVTAAELPAEEFHKLAHRHPQISIVLTRLLAKRLGRKTWDALTGKTLDNFEIERRLGRGGMGVVYAARHRDTSQRVALKMMNHRLVYDEVALEFFRREAQIVESFNHPNIVRVLGKFRAFHTYFIVMEFCEGQSLAKLIQYNGPSNEQQCRSLLNSIASALRYAHGKNIIHCDVKPANVMLAADGTVKLTDFGLARSSLNNPSEVLSQMVGTPCYMAPEQIANGVVSPASDYFALGCLAYELLTGIPLFPSNDLAELQEMHETWSPDQIQDECLGVGRELLQAIESSLCRDPRRRKWDL